MKYLVRIHIFHLLLVLSQSFRVFDSTTNAYTTSYHSVLPNTTTHVQPTEPPVEPKYDVALDLSNIHLLKLDNNFISSLYITKLTLRNNYLTSFEENAFENMPNLEFLDLSHNKLNLQNMFNFYPSSNLKTLILDYNNYYIHDDIHDDDMIYNTITHSINYDTSIKQFHNLKFLSLKYINLREINRDLNYYFPNLYHLDISGNLIKNNIASVLSQIPSSVKSLSISDNKLTEFIGSSEFIHIQILNLAKNTFIYVHYNDCFTNTLCLRSMQNLEMLNISNCEIEVIQSNAFDDLVNLLELDISNNQIRNLNSNTLNGLSKLKRLDISENNYIDISNLKLINLHTLIMNDIKSHVSLVSLELPNLKKLVMRNNQLTSFYNDAFDKLPLLEELDLSHNQLKNLSEMKLPNYATVISLRNNDITNINNISSVINSNVKILDIGNNPLQKIEMKYLKQLSEDAVIIL